jgi:hypothetical protein
VRVRLRGRGAAGDARRVEGDVLGALHLRR